MLIVAAGGAIPIQPREMIFGFAWFDALVVIAAVFTVMYQIEHDNIISRLSSTKSGITWDRAFLTRALMYGAVPLLTLFATQFPEIGETVSGWFTHMPKVP